MERDRDELGYEEARERVVAKATPIGSETVTLADALGRYLSEPLIARGDSPPFDNSAVDGYGVTVADLEKGPVALPLVGSVAAGEGFRHELAAGATIQVLTGAPVPDGVEAVVMQEAVSVAARNIRFHQPVKMGANIRRRGEEFRQGDTVAMPGSICNPGLLALAASCGYSSVQVGKAPRVAIVTTGDELIPPGEQLGPGQIWESNSIGLMSALRSLGIDATRLKAKDSLESVEDALKMAFECADVILIAGGVSVGARDFVKPVCENMGVQREFWGVKIKPGGPLYFGTRGSQLVFGLPGNPVSALVTFFIFARPALLKMMGAHGDQATVSAKLTAPLKGKTGKLEFVRGRLLNRDGELQVEPVEARGSHMISGLSAADCLIHFAETVDFLETGSVVSVTRLEW